MWFQRRMATLAIFIISLSIGQHAWADVAVLQGTRSLSIEYADQAAWAAPVSYTHLTLPTTRLV